MERALGETDAQVYGKGDKGTFVGRTCQALCAAAGTDILSERRLHGQAPLVLSANYAFASYESQAQYSDHVALLSMSIATRSISIDFGRVLQCRQNAEQCFYPSVLRRKTSDYDFTVLE